MRPPLSHLSVSIFLCVAASIGYGVWYSVLSAKSEEVANLENDIRAKTETANRIAATRTVLASVANEEEIVRGYFVPETGVVAFIDALEAQGKKQGAVVRVLSVENEEVKKQPSLALSLTVKGTFEAVMRTVGAVEHVPYDLSVSRLTVTQDGKNMWQANLTLLVGSLPATNETAEMPSTETSPQTTHAFF